MYGTEVWQTAFETEPLKMGDETTEEALADMTAHVNDPNTEAFCDASDVEAHRQNFYALKEKGVEHRVCFMIFMISRELWAPSAIKAFCGELCSAAGQQTPTAVGALELLGRMASWYKSTMWETVEGNELLHFAPKLIANTLDMPERVRALESHMDDLERVAAFVTSNDDVLTKRPAFDKAVALIKKAKAGHGDYNAPHAMRQWNYNCGYKVPGDRLLPMGSGANIPNMSSPDAGIEALRPLGYLTLVGLDAGELAFIACSRKNKPRARIDLYGATVSTWAALIQTPPPPPATSPTTTSSRGRVKKRKHCDEKPKQPKQQRITEMPRSGTEKRTAPTSTPASTPSDDKVGGGITRIMATSQRTANGMTVYMGKDANGFPRAGEALDAAWVHHNIQKQFLQTVVWPELDKWHKVPLGSAASDPASAAGDASGGGLRSAAVPSAPDGSVVDESLPPVPFAQGTEDTCFSCAGANALGVAGDFYGAAHVAAQKLNLACDVVKNQLGPLARLLEGNGWTSEMESSWYPGASTDTRRTGLVPYMIDNPYDGPTVVVLRDDKGVADHVVAIYDSLIFDSNHSRAMPLTRESFDRCVDTDRTGAKCNGIARAMRLVPTKKMAKKLAAASDDAASDDAAPPPPDGGARDIAVAASGCGDGPPLQHAHEPGCFLLTDELGGGDPARA